MKRFLFVLCLMISVISLSNLSAQGTPMSLSVNGGYSWLTGVVGGEAQFGNIGIGGGWFPTKMPMSGIKIHSYSGAISYYTSKAGEEGESYYITVAQASQGFRYEDSWGGEYTLPMTIAAIGVKYDTGGVWSKLGVGYGWCDEGNSWTGELTIGFILFGN